eukprot:Transcript_10691.p2 GENE.Transcript_10691~~Transcript_10691.p2  ORF type:complete len:231 (-),score=28.32 Transcript_10691:492-1184(-)
MWRRSTLSFVRECLDRPVYSRMHCCATSRAHRAWRWHRHLGTAATAAAAATGSICACEHPDARWYRELAEHQALGLSVVEDAKLGVWHEVTRRLRDGLSDPNEADEAGVTLLHIAARAGRRRLVEELLERGANQAARDGLHGRSALHYAAAAGHAAVIETLLRRGADATAADATGATALHLAAQAGEERAVRALLPHADPRACATIAARAPQAHPQRVCIRLPLRRVRLP